MRKLALQTDVDRPVQILCLGAHSDDIEIGCGGTVLRLIEDYPRVCFTWVVFGANARRKAEAQAGADAFLKGAVEKRVILLDFQDGYFPYVGAKIKDFFEQLKLEVTPDLILTHTRHDLHQDHRLICELTWNTFRDHLILEYEIPKYDGDLGSPNVYFPLGEDICNRKIAALMHIFQTQNNRHWFTEDIFSSLLRLRGMESRSPSGCAEAFYGKKLVL